MTYARDERGTGEAARARDVEAVLRRERRLMLAVARRQSLCEDDAEDAVQAASERYLRYRDRVDPETTQGWLLTVARNEAVRVRERRVRAGVGSEPDEHLADPGPAPPESVTDADRAAVAHEALAALKPAERLALLLQAEGHSYDEIAERTDWTRTKVNRSLTEGRAALRRRAAEAEDGAACATLAPARARLAAGRADARDLIALRPHLRRCGACRAELRVARGGRLVVAPALLLAWWQDGVDRLARAARWPAELLQRTGGVVPGGGSAGEGGTALAAGVVALVAAGAVGVGATVGPDAGGRDAVPRERTAASAGGPIGARAAVVPAVAPVAEALGDRGVSAVRAERRAAARARARTDGARARPRSAPAATPASAPARSPAPTAAPSPAPAPDPAPRTAASPAPAPAPTAPSRSGGGGGGGGGAAQEFGFE